MVVVTVVVDDILQYERWRGMGRRVLASRRETGDGQGLKETHDKTSVVFRRTRQLTRTRNSAMAVRERREAQY